MSFFSKVFKGAGKLIKKNIGTIGRAGLGVITGGASEAVIRAAKPLGAALGAIKRNRKADALKIEPLSVRSSIAKYQQRAAVKLPPPSMGNATTHPGGAPLRLIRIGKAKRRAAPKTARKPARATRATTKKAKATTTRRKAPTGGKDFKKLSASWKAAGKPGKWIDWVKAG